MTSYCCCLKGLSLTLQSAYPTPVFSLWTVPQSAWWHKPDTWDLSWGLLCPSFPTFPHQVLAPNDVSASHSLSVTTLPILPLASVLPDHTPFLSTKHHFHREALCPTSLGSFVLCDVQMFSFFFSSQTLLQVVIVWSPRWWILWISTFPLDHNLQESRDHDCCGCHYVPSDEHTGGAQTLWNETYEKKRKDTELKWERRTSNQVSQCNHRAFLPTVV